MRIEGTIGVAKTPKKDDTSADERESIEAIDEATDAVEASAPQDVVEATAPDGDSSDTDKAEPPVSNDESVDDTADDGESDQTEPLVQTVETKVIERKGGFIPMVLGGAVAAGIGFFGAQYYDDLMNGAGSDLQTQMADLSARLDGIPVVDIAPLDSGLSDAQSRINALANRIDALGDQVTELAKRPVSTGDAGASVDLSAVTAQLDDLRAALDTQKGTIAKMVEAAQADKHDAEAIARQTMARAAVTRILVSLDSGAPFEDALADVEANTDIAIPEALGQTASSGVPTVSALSDAFPAAARTALAASRSETPSGGVGNFLTRQLGVRSVEPRAGNDPDAVLSRMEAAVRDGRLADALAEMDSLPDVAKAPLAQWADQARLRLMAVQEAETLATSLNSQ